MILEVLFFLIVIFGAYVNARIDSDLILWRMPIDHLSNTLIRFSVGLVISGFYYIHSSSIENTLWFLFTCMSIFWASFDLMLNLMRGKDWYYIGNTAFIDKLFNKLPASTPFMHFLKLFCILLGIGMLIELT